MRTVLFMTATAALLSAPAATVPINASIDTDLDAEWWGLPSLSSVTNAASSAFNSGVKAVSDAGKSVANVVMGTPAKPKPKPVETLEKHCETKLFNTFQLS